MRINYLYYMLLAGVLLFVLPVKSENLQPVDMFNQRHHVIVAFNWSPSPNDWVYSYETKNAVCALSSFEVEDGTGKGRRVLQQGDVFSCVAFRADVKNNNLEQYIQPITASNGSPVQFQKIGDVSFDGYVNGDWDTWLNCRPFGVDISFGYSLLSVAKPYCLKYFAAAENRILANRTFLVMVSDKQFNGDMYDEVANLRRDNLQYGYHAKGIGDEQVFPVYYDVNQSYFIRQLSSRPIMSGTNSWAAPKGYVQLFEFVPLQKNFVLSSVFDYPVQLKAKRIRGGKYSCSLLMTNRKHPLYNPVRLQVYLNDELQKTWDAVEIKDSVKYIFEQCGAIKASNVSIKCWVRLQDGIYNTTLMSPMPDATKESGRDGLNVTLDIEYEKKAKIFFVPMPDFMWLDIMPDDQAVAALLWELILGLITVALVIAGIVRLFHNNQYITPDVNEMKFRIRYKNR